MPYSPLPNPWKNIPYVGPLIDAMQTALASAASAFQIRKNGTNVGARGAINFIEGGNIDITATDDLGNDEVDVEIALDGAGAVEFADLVLIGLDASKPSSGYRAGRLYIATDTNKLYRDSGSAWVQGLT